MLILIVIKELSLEEISLYQSSELLYAFIIIVNSFASSNYITSSGNRTTFKLALRVQYWFFQAKYLV